MKSLQSDLSTWLSIVVILPQSKLAGQLTHVILIGLFLQNNTLHSPSVQILQILSFSFLFLTTI